MYCVYLGQAKQTVNAPDGSVGSSQVAASIITGQTALGATPADTDELLIIYNLEPEYDFSDDNLIIEKLKKSKFNVPKLNGQPQVGKINHVVVVPAGFCVA